MNKRYAFVVSDRTGITVEALAHSLMSQFPSIDFKAETFMFIDSIEKAHNLVEKINQAYETSAEESLVFMTVVNDDVRETLMKSRGVFYDLFGTFIEPMELELGTKSSHKVGKSHGVTDAKQYTSRISAMQFSLNTDDGMELGHYRNADVIIVGVSRSGKTPTSLYLSLHYSLFAANYPLTIEELEKKTLPQVLLDHKDKLFGLTIDPMRLLQIRQERYKGESYSSMKICQQEVAQAEALFRAAKIPFLNTTKMSIEEIGATLLQKTGIRRELS